MTPFRRLLALFSDRFFEDDTASPDTGFETNIYQVVSLLVSPGIFITWFAMPAYLELATKPLGPQGQWTLRLFRLFFPAFSFAVVGFATFFQWDKLFPDRRDFLILGGFPLRLRTILAAKVVALCLFLLILVAAINLVPNLVVPLLSGAIPEVRRVGYLRIAGSQIAATAGASLFAFLVVAALQGVLINLTSPRVFQRISPWIQALGMSAMILTLLTFPIYAMLLAPASKAHAPWLWYFPPVWFTGWYDLLLKPADPLFSTLGWLAVKATAFAAALFCLTWGLGFRRHYRRTLESEDTGSVGARINLFARVPGSTKERAIFQFTGRILARSSRHRLFLASYWSVGIAIGLIASVAVRNGHLSISPDGLRAFPLLIVFFVVSGFRVAFQFPSELASNWLFRTTEEQWTEISRRATRKRVLASGVLPILLSFLPLEIAYWGLGTAIFHAAFQLAIDALLVEVLFWRFDKVPFTCSYFPGKVNFALLFGMYLYGFTAYSFRMSDLEAALEAKPLWAVLFFPAAAAILAFCWRRNPKPAEVRFDASEPTIQTLGLT